DPALLPKKLDNSQSIWGYWNNKGPTCMPASITGTFSPGETVRSNSGAQFPFEKSWQIDGKTYLQFGTYPSNGKFQPGDALTGLTSGAGAIMVEWPKIIANHGSNTWGSNGKSLLMNLGDNDNANALKGVGAQRLGVFFGDGASGKSGYKKIHVFMMIKFAPAFFGVTGAQADVDY
ncbi:MAG TPA: hypothetical protein DCP85_09055, partial [Elusimicrobia bacterium]|nr:hypothetical protein [Elusimicrobiota bacterium]